ncbi:hypothetical protein ASD21_02280 [Caulobacter sp. Root1455]|uniref:DUF6491 family protein n=1 Tax=Caulobacter sp. Root1455 TaxID=1736465 RepID=UPI0006F3BC8B|nr:DUF6491 family protein [Caulobacter sp. Root1455]KQZ06481.1 hypothetical protein ASD21_02280 [Caulobacter sp. Root1455]
MTGKTTLRALSIGAASLACALTSAAFAAEPSAARDCFEGTKVADWVAIDDHTILLKTQQSDFYRIDLARPIRQLNSPAARLNVGSKNRMVCAAADLNVNLFLTASMNMPLGVSKVTRMSAEEVATAGSANLPGRRYRGERLADF